MKTRARIPSSGEASRMYGEEYIQGQIALRQRIIDREAERAAIDRRQRDRRDAERARYDAENDQALRERQERAQAERQRRREEFALWEPRVRELERRAESWAPIDLALRAADFDAAERALVSRWAAERMAVRLKDWLADQGVWRKDWRRPRRPGHTVEGGEQ